MINPYSIVFCLLTFCFGFAQNKFKVIVNDADDYRMVYSLLDQKTKILKKLDPANYVFSINDEQYHHFAIFGLKDYRTWAAIDFNENILFRVYNTVDGEPNPDWLRHGRIRIVDENNKIGFANAKGKIIIKPQFEIVTSFYKGKAIFGQNCSKIPWGDHSEADGCRHFSTVCSRHGYVDKKGKIILLENYSFEELKDKLKWKEGLN